MPEGTELDVEAGATLDLVHKSASTRRQSSTQSYEKLKEFLKVLGLIAIVLCVLYSTIAGSTSSAETVSGLSKFTNIIAAATLEWREGNQTIQKLR
jgi:predicted membrane protein